MHTNKVKEEDKKMRMEVEDEDQDEETAIVQRAGRLLRVAGWLTAPHVCECVSEPEVFLLLLYFCVCFSLFVAWREL